MKKNANKNTKHGKKILLCGFERVVVLWVRFLSLSLPLKKPCTDVVKSLLLLSSPHTSKNARSHVMHRTFNKEVAVGVLQLIN
jgi:hypothetical protein